MKWMKNLPNQLTVSRIIMIFVFLALSNVDARSVKPNFIKFTEDTAYICHVIAYIVAIVAGLTDLFDGYLARKYHCKSDFGRLADPLADKIFILATYIMMADYKIIPSWMVVVMISREFLVTGLRMIALREGKVISADMTGKLKTCLQMGVLLVGGAGWIRLFGFDLLHNKPVWAVWYSLMLVTTLFTIYSGINYFVKNYKILKSNL